MTHITRYSLMVLDHVLRIVMVVVQACVQMFVLDVLELVMTVQDNFV